MQPVFKHESPQKLPKRLDEYATGGSTDLSNNLTTTARSVIAGMMTA
jgi:hypothetical protein